MKLSVAMYSYVEIYLKHLEIKNIFQKYF